MALHPSAELLQILEPLAERAWRGLDDAPPGPFLLSHRALAPGRTPEGLREALSALYAHARRWAPGLEVPALAPSVTLGEHPASAASSSGERSAPEAGDASVTVAAHLVGDEPALRRVLAHEAGHQIALHSGLDRGSSAGPDEDRLVEITADVLAFVCGFGELVLRGFLRSPGCGRSRDRAYRGYLSGGDCYALHEWVRARRAALGLAGAPEPARAAAPGEVAREEVDPGVHEVVAAAARGAWDRARELAREGLEDWYQDCDPLVHAAALALAAGRSEVARELLAVGGLVASVDALDALQDGDGELAYVALVMAYVSPTDGSGHVLTEPGGAYKPGYARLQAWLAERCAALLEAGDWTDRILAAHTLVLAAGEGGRGDVPDRRARWLRARDMPLGTSGYGVAAAALAAVHVRRRGAEGARAFERWLASQGHQLVDAMPEMLPEAGLLAERALATRVGSYGELMTWAAWRLSEGRGDELPARFAEAARSERQRPRYARYEADARADFARKRERWAGGPRHVLLDDAHDVDAVVELGTFELVTGALTVTDPCAGYRGPINAYLPRARRGTWVARAALREVERQGAQAAVERATETRVAMLYAHHREAPCALVDEVWEDPGALIGVDSGAAGVFDAESVRNERVVAREDVARFTGENRWFDLCCARSAAPHFAGVVPGGCVAVAGWGDGAYPCLVAYDERRFAVAVCIDFLMLDDDDDDDDDEDHDDDDDDDDDAPKG